MFHTQRGIVYAEFSVSKTAFIIFICCVIVSQQLASSNETAPSNDSAHKALILNYESQHVGVNGYKFAFKTSDGITRKETAMLKNIGTENEAISVQGTVSWTGPEGIQYTLNYLADENGFQPEGGHLPTVIPEV